MKRTRQPNPPTKPANGSGRTWEHLIRPPRPRFTGFDWTRTERLKPTGDADRDKVLAERLRPPTPLREDQQ